MENTNIFPSSHLTRGKAPFRPSAAAAAGTHHYAAAPNIHDWVIGYQLKSPDCVRELAVTINGQTSGPTIRAMQGDTVVVRVNNSLVTESAVIHWHGIRQVGTPWADGTEVDTTGAGFAFHGAPRRGATCDGFGFEDCGQLSYVNCASSCTVQTGHVHDAYGHVVAFDGALHRGAAGHPHNASGDSFESDGVTGHTHDANGDGFMSDGEPHVQSVWRDNCAEVFEHVVARLHQPRRHLYVALDLEFVADASTDVHYRPISWIDWYDQLRTFVNGGDVIQVGLALAFELEHHPGGAHQAPSPVIALEINLEFDEDARKYNGASISFLAKQGHRLAEHRDRGVTTEQFINGLLRHLVSSGHDDPITWIMYHGDYDLGFLMRLLQEQQQQGRERGVLPSDRATFMREVRRQFPIFYDLRVLGQLVKEAFSGKFSVLAELLPVQRIGNEHHAGSDALLNMSCFSKILHRSQHELHRLDSRKCLLSGMEEYDMAIKCARHIDDVRFTTVEVRGRNFDDEARRIVKLVTSNFKIVGVHVLLPPLGRGSPICAAAAAAAAEQKDYDLMKSSLEGICEFQVEIGFMNAEGMLAFGRVWRFYLRRTNARIVLAGEDESCVDPRRLAWLLASCGATHNPDVVWVTYQGLEGIACLIKSSLPAGDLPGDWSSYHQHRRARFPGMYDVGLIAQRWPDTGVLPTGCRGTLYDIARNLKIIKDDDRYPMGKVILVLRCYKRLEESPHFSLIASVVRGQFMASRSCRR